MGHGCHVCDCPNGCTCPPTSLGQKPEPETEAEIVERRTYVEELAVARTAMRIAAAMDEAAMTQKQVADVLGVAEARVSQILNGEENLTVKLLARIADALGQEFEPTFNLVVNEVPRVATGRVATGSDR